MYKHTKKIVIFTALLFSTFLFAQETVVSQNISGTVVNDATLLPLWNINIININRMKGATTNARGVFEIEAALNDTLNVSSIGFQSIKVRVTNDWIKSKTSKIKLTEKAVALEEVVVRKYNLTGFLEIDSKLIPIRENHRYSISGLNSAYEAGNYAPGAFGKVLGSLFNPADVLYSFFGKKPRELKRLREMKKDDTVRNLLESKFDRETISALLGIDKNEIAEIMARCSYSEEFVKTANDLQIMDAISECYEEYKILKKK
jgi:CarboxypepD_reg-like domain